MNPHKKSIGILLALCFGVSLTGVLLWNLMAPPMVYAANITVNTTADEYNNDGDCSLREAIAAANTNTAVDACTPGSGPDLIQFSLPTPAIITLTQGQLVIQNSALTISGPGAANLTINGNNLWRIFDITTNTPVTLTGITLQNGQTTLDGGAVRSRGTLTVVDAVLKNNAAGADGGAIDVDGNLTLQNTDILSNTASGEGGGINAFGTQTMVTNGRFLNNQSGSYGGAIYANGAITIDGTNIISNAAQLYAGGVWAWNTATVTNATFERNKALNLNAGALYVRYDLQLSASTFVSNTAAQNIGAVWASQNATVTSTAFLDNAAATGRSAALQVHGSLWLTSTQWLGNQAAVPGGAVVHLGQDGRVVNSLFARNIGGAAVFEHNGTVELLHNTVVGPVSPTAPAVTINASGSLAVQNSIIGAYPTGLDILAGSVTEDNNLFFATTAVSGTVTRGGHSYDGDPAFVDAANDNYHLSANSEALNTGADLGLTTDFEGDARPGGSGIDLGYDETTFAADVSLGKTAVSSPGPNQPITYTLTFTNVGSAMLPRLTITDNLPTQVVAPIVISSSVPITDASGELPYVWQVHNLSPGATGIITVTGVLSDVLPRGFITNTATVQSIALETNLANNVASAAINVPNVGPVAVDDIVTIGEDETVVLHPTLNDIDGDVLTIESFLPPSSGTAVLSGTQQIVYTPTLEFSGQDFLTYTVSDGESNDTAAITITVTAENDAPIISEGASVSLTISEDNAPTAFSLTLNATDAESSPLGWSVSTQAANGTATAAYGPASSSLITYQPAANFFGTDQFQVQVTDGALADSIMVYLTIEPVNDAPLGVADTAVVLRRPSGSTTVLAAGSTGSLNVLDNDTDVENSALTVTGVSSPDQGGTVLLSSNGALQTYAPASTLVGVETFSYTVDDGELADTAVVHLNVVEGANGGIGGDSFSIANLGEQNDFTVNTQIPANVASGGNFALIFNQTEAGSVAELKLTMPPATAPNGFVPVGLTFNLVPYLDGQPLADSYQFEEPITLVIDYGDTAVTTSGPSEKSLALYFSTANAWSQNGVQIVERDLAQHRLVLTLNHGGTFTLFRREFVYIPLLLNNFAQAPDLVVTSLTATANTVQVVIKNIGNAPVTQEFWVDVYVNPQLPPTAVNQTWEMRGSQGLAWGILADALPLNPGETMTLTTTSPYFAANTSHVIWPLPTGSQLYAQVDSNNPGFGNGAVLELHEMNGTVYNNILGPQAAP